MNKIYGPYKRKDGRKHVIIYNFEKGIRKTVSYPKYIMEKYLGRKLKKWETVDHIDGDFSNDDLENLQILSRAENIRKSCYKKQKYIFHCPICNKKFSKLLTPYSYAHATDKGGPYCSKSCCGKGNYRNSK